MKFFKENDKTPFILVAFGIILYLVLSNLQIVFAGLSYASSVAFPFILGSCLAFIINVPMRFFETPPHFGIIQIYVIEGVFMNVVLFFFVYFFF